MAMEPRDDPYENMLLYIVLAAICFLLISMVVGAYRLHAARTPVTFEERWPDRATLRDWEIRSWLARLPQNTAITTRRDCEYSYRRREFCA